MEITWTHLKINSKIYAGFYSVKCADKGTQKFKMMGCGLQSYFFYTDTSLFSVEPTPICNRCNPRVEIECNV